MLRRMSGHLFPAQLRLLRSKLPDEEGALELKIVIVDLTELKETQHALEMAKQTLELRVEARTQELSRLNTDLAAEVDRRMQLEGQLLEISERERRRFGQDLHDETCQALSGFAMELKTLSKRVENGDPGVVPPLHQLALSLNDLVDKTRRIARGLHPVALAGGLSEALNELAANTSPKLHSVFRGDGRALPLTPEVELALYRIAQEAMTNVLKHANATQAVIRLDRHRTRVVLSVEDNGDGLPPEMPVAQNGGGMGLDILGYRARSIGAQLAVENLPRGGVRVACHLPMSAMAKRPGKVSTREGR
jgi:hypothetical protein